MVGKRIDDNWGCIDLINILYVIFKTNLLYLSGKDFQILCDLTSQIAYDPKGDSSHCLGNPKIIDFSEDYCPSKFFPLFNYLSINLSSTQVKKSIHIIWKVFPLSLVNLRSFDSLKHFLCCKPFSIIMMMAISGLKYELCYEI